MLYFTYLLIYSLNKCNNVSDFVEICNIYYLSYLLLVVYSLKYFFCCLHVFVCYMHPHQGLANSLCVTDLQIKQNVILIRDQTSVCLNTAITKALLSEITSSLSRSHYILSYTYRQCGINVDNSHSVARRDVGMTML